MDISTRASYGKNWNHFERKNENKRAQQQSSACTIHLGTVSCVMCAIQTLLSRKTGLPRA